MKIFNFFIKKSKGFTLIELLVSVAIISTISGATFVYFRYSNQTWALIRAAQTVSQDIKRASNMALSSPSYNCPVSASCGAGGSSCIDGYGIYFDVSTNTSYKLFVDCNSNNAYNGGATDVLVETISLESGIKIKELNPAGSFSVVFVPPDPTTNFSSGTSGIVTLSLISDTSKTKQLTINNKGNIDIQ